VKAKQNISINRETWTRFETFTRENGSTPSEVIEALIKRLIAYAPQQ
jgi:hypothetical protein